MSHLYTNANLEVISLDSLICHNNEDTLYFAKKKSQYPKGTEVDLGYNEAKSVAGKIWLLLHVQSTGL